MDRGAWQTTLHEVAKSWTELKWLGTQYNKTTGVQISNTDNRLTEDWTWIDKTRWILNINFQV